MNSKILYSNNGKLEKQIRSKKIIPYRIFPNEDYKLNKWYYSFFYNTVFKVLELQYNDGKLEYAYTISDDGNSSMICTDLDANEDYSISRDKRCIYKLDIINHDESFTGAEIIYWFFINNITIFNTKYAKFWKYVDRYSLNRISDRERYFIKGDLVDGRYVNCEVIKDTSKQEYNRIMKDKIYKIESDRFMNELKEKDLDRIKEIHQNDYL